MALWLNVAGPDTSEPDARVQSTNSTQVVDCVWQDKPNTVYLKSSARQFAQQEARNWRQQVGRDPEGQAAVCLAAYVDDTVQGCLDLIKVPGQPAGSSQVT